jgi:Ca2+-transporting ATPase
MEQPPRDPNEGIFARGLGVKIITQGIFIGVVTLIAYWFGYHTSGSLDEAGREVVGRTMAFFTLSLSQLIHSFNTRYERKSVIANGMFKNKYLNYAFLVSFLIQIIVLITPTTRSIFKITLIAPIDIAVVVLCSIAPLIAVEIVKMFKR